MVAIMAVNMAFLIVLERASMGFKPLKPAACLGLRSVFLVTRKVLEAIGPTDLGHGRRHPVRGMLLRALGMKVGAKLFDGGAGLSTGDDVVIDADSFLMKGEILDLVLGGVEIRPSECAARRLRPRFASSASPTPPTKTSDP